MERNFETVMVEQCAPVLAGLKPAGLFRYETGDCADLARRVKSWNIQLNPKGLQVRVLKGCVRTRQYLVYVYRESKLEAVLAQESVQSFLRQEGYRLPETGVPEVGNLLAQLSRRLCQAAFCPADQVHCGVSAAVPQRNAHSPPCRGSLNFLLTFSFQILSFYPGTRLCPRTDGKKSSF